MTVVTAKAGDKVLLYNGPVQASWSEKKEYEVAAPCVQPGEDGPSGHWVCATHDLGFDSNIQKDEHIREGDHELVWVCHEHGPEEP